jgi:hypothetical protein
MSFPRVSTALPRSSGVRLLCTSAGAIAEAGRARKPTYICCWSCTTERDVFPFGDVDDPGYACPRCAERWGWRLHGWVLADAARAPAAVPMWPTVPQYASRPSIRAASRFRLPVVTLNPLASRLLIAILASVAGYATHFFLQRFVP